MPNPSIDLQRDCELWCDFDTDYFNSQRNKILDRSGNGRNPEAIGGPTLGKNGPDNFEAASFDGNDDLFKPPDFNTQFGGPNPFTIHALVSTQAFGNDQIIELFDFVGIEADANGSYSLAGISPDGNFIVDNLQNADETGVFFDITYTYDGTTRRGFVDGILNAENTTQVKTGSGCNFIGSNINPNRLDGRLSTIALWSRVLSGPEIEYLTRLTEPRRAQL
jgi:hypothetical protein